jgi:hypothetical protein
MLDRGNIAVLLCFAMLVLATGCGSNKAGDTLNHPVVRIAMDANNSIPSCFATLGWVTIPGSGTIDWTAGPKDANTYQIEFPVSPYPLTDVSGNAVTAPIVVTSAGSQSGSTKGPFKVSDQANYSCKASADAGRCYFSYDVTYKGRSCVQRYGNGAGVYTTGFHLER